jgi:hypothetical protein
MRAVLRACVTLTSIPYKPQTVCQQSLNQLPFLALGEAMSTDYAVLVVIR